MLAFGLEAVLRNGKAIKQTKTSREFLNWKMSATLFPKEGLALKTRDNKLSVLTASSRPGRRWSRDDFFFIFFTASKTFIGLRVARFGARRPIVAIARFSLLPHTPECTKYNALVAF